ncbi:hypothetical protein F2Q69_00055708, partial [Brassica cretica]
MSSIPLESADQYPLGCLDSLGFMFLSVIISLLLVFLSFGWLLFVYLHSLQILTRELMLIAIARISNGEIEFAQWICQFAREIHRGTLASVAVPQMDGNYYMKSKTEVMLQSVIKTENNIAQISYMHLSILENYIPLLGENGPTSYILGGADVEAASTQGVPDPSSDVRDPRAAPTCDIFLVRDSIRQLASDDQATKDVCDPIEATRSIPARVPFVSSSRLNSFGGPIQQSSKVKSSRPRSASAQGVPDPSSDVRDPRAAPARDLFLVRDSIRQLASDDQGVPDQATKDVRDPIEATRSIPARVPFVSSSRLNSFGGPIQQSSKVKSSRPRSASAQGVPDPSSDVRDPRAAPARDLFLVRDSMRQLASRSCPARGSTPLVVRFNNHLRLKAQDVPDPSSDVRDPRAAPARDIFFVRDSIRQLASRSCPARGSTPLVVRFNNHLSSRPRSASAQGVPDPSSDVRDPRAAPARDLFLVRDSIRQLASDDQGVPDQATKDVRDPIEATRSIPARVPFVSSSRLNSFGGPIQQSSKVKSSDPSSDVRGPRAAPALDLFLVRDIIRQLASDDQGVPDQATKSVRDPIEATRSIPARVPFVSSSRPVRVQLASRSCPARGSTPLVVRFNNHLRLK